jgi:hypothetical protein
LAAIKPDAPIPPTSVNNGSRVLLNWSPPSDNPQVDYGDIIRRYKVMIARSQENEFSYDLINCDGENDHFVIDNCHCELPMTTL